MELESLQMAKKIRRHRIRRYGKSSCKGILMTCGVPLGLSVMLVAMLLSGCTTSKRHAGDEEPLIPNLTHLERNSPESKETNEAVQARDENITGITAEVETMRLSSEEFKEGDDIPKIFTCQGIDISPRLSWTGPPRGTKSFALSVIDPDARGWTHWLVYNIPYTTRSIPKGSVPGIQVVNDFGQQKYGGPCPPSGKHKYVFTVYALDVADLGQIGKGDFLLRVKEHTLKDATLTGRYQKS